MVSHLDQGSRVTLLLISCEEMAPTMSKILDTAAILDTVAASAERHPNAWKPLCKNFRSSAVAAAPVGGGFLVGNVVGGPVGGCIGGLLGLAVGFLIQEDGVERLPTTIANMTNEERQDLAWVITQVCFRLYAAETEREMSIALNDSQKAACVATEASKQVK